MPWDDGIDWNPGDPLYTEDPLTVIQDGGDPGTIPGGTGASFDWTKLLGNLGQGVGGALSSGSSGGGNPLASLFGGGGGDLSGLLALLALLGGVGSSINAGNTARQGGQDIKDAANASNATAQELFGKAQGNFAPYQAAGVSALDRLAVPQDLASKFVAKGSPSNMGGQFKGSMTLADLAKR